VGNLLDYNDSPEATQYFQSKRYWPPDKLESLTQSMQVAGPKQKIK
jgi:hypothetical protein